MPRKTRRVEERQSDVVFASMRPRPDAAENPGRMRWRRAGRRRFNEAAARCRGKPSSSRMICPPMEVLQ